MICTSDFSDHELLLWLPTIVFSTFLFMFQQFCACLVSGGFICYLLGIYLSRVLQSSLAPLIPCRSYETNYKKQLPVNSALCVIIYVAFSFLGLYILWYNIRVYFILLQHNSSKGFIFWLSASLIVKGSTSHKSIGHTNVVP